MALLERKAKGKVNGKAKNQLNIPTIIPSEITMPRIVVDLAPMARITAISRRLSLTLTEMVVARPMEPMTPAKTAKTSMR